MSAVSTEAAACIDTAQRIATGEAEAPASTDRRSHRRFAFDAEIPAVWAGSFGANHEIVLLRSQDISSGGICLVGRSMAHVGALGVIRLPLPESKSAFVGIEVMHCRYLGDMHYAIGCRFTTPPDPLKGMRFVEKGGRLHLMR